MKCLLIASALLLALAPAARASSHYEMTYHDNIRPNGHPRGDAVINASLDACYGATGLKRTAADNAAFKKCMATKGYRWVSTKLVQNPAPVVARGADERYEDAAQTEEANNWQAKLNAEALQRSQQQTQDMIDTQNEVDTQAAIAAQEAADSQQAASFAAQMTVGNQ